MNQDDSAGQILDLGGNRMYFRLRGQRGRLPAFVLEAGASGTASNSWPLIEDELARHSLVFSYDRAGLGSSTEDGRGYGAPAVCARLHRLLAEVRVPSPYILVGHSLGGLYIRYFAAMHPGNVAGLVLLDATPEDLPIPQAMLRQTARLMHLGHWIGRSGLPSLYLRLRKPRHSMLARMLVDLGAPGRVKRLGSELEAIGDVQRQVADLAPSPLHPVIGIAASKRWPMRSADIARLESLQQRTIALAPGPLSRFCTIAGASHNSLLANEAHAGQSSKLMLDFAEQLPPMSA